MVAICLPISLLIPRYNITNISCTVLKVVKLTSLGIQTLYYLHSKSSNSPCFIIEIKRTFKLACLHDSSHLGMFGPNHSLILCYSTVCLSTGTEIKAIDQYLDRQRNNTYLLDFAQIHDLLIVLGPFRSRYYFNADSYAQCLKQRWWIMGRGKFD